MDTQVQFSPQARALFAERIKKMDEGAGWGKLPPLDVAMEPSRVSFSDDLSDGENCNNRFIESRIVEGEGAAVLYMLGMWHNMLFFCFSMFCITEGKIYWWLLVPYLLFGVGFCLNSIRLCIKLTRNGSGRVRFNRQAQLVHFLGGKEYDVMMSLPWRSAVAFTEFYGISMSGGNVLKLLFPTPDGVDDGGKVLEARGALRMGDGDFSSNLSRLEFLRRYMAHGLEAVQPGRQAIEAGVVSPPSGYTDQPMPTGLSAFSKFTWQFWRYLLDKPMYYAGGGPLIDRWIKRAADSYRWPEEVERLCAEGADLSGIDTTPVATHTNLFYRYGGMHNPIQYVDAQGRELR